MRTVPRLSRSFPFWLLLVGSLASIGYGAWLTIDKLTTMTSTLEDGTATGVEVYVGQSWAVFAAAFVGAGLVGLVAVLALVVASSFVSRPVEIVEAIEWSEQPSDETADDDTIDDAPAVDETTAEAETVNETTETAATEEPAQPLTR